MIVRRENWPELTQKRPTHKPDLAQKDRPANRIGLFYLVDNDRIATIDRIVDQSCLVFGEVDAAVAAGAGFVAVSSEGRLPGCVVKSLTVYERHPVVYFDIVAIFFA